MIQSLKNMSAQRRVVLYAGVLLLIALAIGFLTMPSRSASSADKILYNPPALGELVLGAADAPVVVVEYASLTCNHCGIFHNFVLPELKRDYVDKGLVKFVFRPFPLDSYAMAGTMMVYCVAPSARLTLWDVMFARQPEWLNSQQPYEFLQAYARQAGLSGEKFTACLQNREILEQVRDIHAVASRDLGVNSTPTFFVNGEKLVGNPGIKVFRAALDEKLTQRTNERP